MDYTKSNKNLGIFENPPAGFRFIQTDEDRKLLALTISQAFGDCFYPIPTYPITHKEYLKLYYELGLRWIDNALEKGVVLCNDDFSGCLILTRMKDCLDTNTIMKKDKTFNFLSPEAKENVQFIFGYTYEDEKYLEYNEDDIYIEIFAVQTPRQGQKLGSQLMKSLFKECDRVKRDILLLTSIETNVSMYKHFGYEILHENHIKEINSDAWYMKRKHGDRKYIKD